MVADFFAVSKRYQSANREKCEDDTFAVQDESAAAKEFVLTHRKLWEKIFSLMTEVEKNEVQERAREIKVAFSKLGTLRLEEYKVELALWRQVLAIRRLTLVALVLIILFASLGQFGFYADYNMLTVACSVFVLVVVVLLVETRIRYTMLQIQKTYVKFAALDLERLSCRVNHSQWQTLALADISLLDMNCEIAEGFFDGRFGFRFRPVPTLGALNFNGEIPEFRFDLWEVLLLKRLLLASPEKLFSKVLQEEYDDTKFTPSGALLH